MLYIIANPISGRKKKNKKIELLVEYLKNNNIEHTLYITKHANHPYEIAKEITSQNESGSIVVFGGDGTFSEVINGIKDLSKWKIGLVPTGSGNDFASRLNIKKDVIEALQTILKGDVKQVDYIKVNDKVCANVVGTGIDVEVLLNFEKHTKLKGKLRYYISLIEALLHVNFKTFDVSIDGGEFVRKTGFMIALCNGAYIGGGIPICPNANYKDGYLEFVFINKIKKISFLNRLVRLLKGKVFDFKETEHILCKKAVFKDKDNLILQIDGNISKDSKEYKCEIVENGLNMFL